MAGCTIMTVLISIIRRSRPGIMIGTLSRWSQRLNGLRVYTQYFFIGDIIIFFPGPCPLFFSKISHRNFSNLSLIFLEILLANAINSPKLSLFFNAIVPSCNQSAYCPLPWADFAVPYVSERARPEALSLIFPKFGLPSLIDCLL